MKTWPGAIGVKKPGNNIFYTLTIWLMEWGFKLFLPPSNTHTAETLHAHTVWFAHLCVPKPSSCKPVDGQTATTAGLRTVNSSLCPGYWAYYCISAKNTHTHSHIHTQRIHRLCVGFNTGLWENMIQLYYFKDTLSLKLIITTTNTIRSKCYQSYQSSRRCVGSAHRFYDVYSFRNDRNELYGI